MVAAATFESVSIEQVPDEGPVVDVRLGLQWRWCLDVVGDNMSWLKGPYLARGIWQFRIINDGVVTIGEGQFDLTSTVGARAAARALYYAIIGVSPAVMSV